MVKNVYTNLDDDQAGFQVGTTPFLPMDAAAKSGHGPVFEMIARTNRTTATTKTRRADWTVTRDHGNLGHADVAWEGVLPLALAHDRTDEIDGPLWGRHFLNEVQLPDVGGERFTVRVKKRRTMKVDRELLSQEILTKRKLWFTIFHTDASQAGEVAALALAVANAFDPLHIILEHVPEATPVAFPHSSAIFSEEGHIGPSRMATAIHGGAFPVLGRAPYHLNITLAKDLATLRTNVYTFTLDPGANDPAESFVFYDGTTEQRSARLASMRYGLLDDHALAQVRTARGLGNFDFADTITKFEISYDGASWADWTAHKTALGRGALIPALRRHVSFDVTFDGPLAMLNTALGDGHTVHFRITAEVLDRGLAAVNSGNGVFVGTHDAGALRGSAELAKITIHEIGHALGLVPDDIYKTGVQNRAWTHPDYYRDHGGTGPHCGLHTVDNGHGVNVHDGIGTMCVMYHAIHASAGSDFCDNCQKFLRQVPLRQGQLGVQWRWYAG